MMFQEHFAQPITHPFQTHPLLEVFSVSNCRLAEKSAENAARRYLKVHTQRCPYLCDREGGGAQEEAALVAHILALVSSDARRRGATLHMLVPFCIDVQQHSNSTHQPELTILYSAVHRHILPARCKYIVVVHHVSSHLYATIFIMGKARLLVMLGRLATQFFFHFFGSQCVNNIFAIKGTIF